VDAQRRLELQKPYGLQLMKSTPGKNMSSKALYDILSESTPHR